MNNQFPTSIFLNILISLLKFSKYRSTIIDNSSKDTFTSVSLNLSSDERLKLFKEIYNITTPDNLQVTDVHFEYHWGSIPSYCLRFSIILNESKEVFRYRLLSYYYQSEDNDNYPTLGFIQDGLVPNKLNLHSNNVLFSDFRYQLSIDSKTGKNQLDILYRQSKRFFGFSHYASIQFKKKIEPTELFSLQLEKPLIFNDVNKNFKNGVYDLVKILRVIPKTYNMTLTPIICKILYSIQNEIPNIFENLGIKYLQKF